jgi:hypothetical protein
MRRTSPRLPAEKRELDLPPSRPTRAQARACARERSLCFCRPPPAHWPRARSPSPPALAPRARRRVRAHGDGVCASAAGLRRIGRERDHPPRRPSLLARAGACVRTETACVLQPPPRRPLDRDFMSPPSPPGITARVAAGRPSSRPCRACPIRIVPRATTGFKASRFGRSRLTPAGAYALLPRNPRSCSRSRAFAEGPAGRVNGSPGWRGALIEARTPSPCARTRLGARGRPASDGNESLRPGCCKLTGRRRGMARPCRRSRLRARRR